jgi:site-specific recombinase XerD
VDTYRKALHFSWEYAREAGWPSDPKKIMPEDIWAAYQQMQHLSSSTQQLYTWTLLRFLIWAGNTNVRDVELKIVVARSRVDWISVEQVGQLIAACSRPYECAVLTVLAYTGARAGECSDLRMNEAQPNQLILRGKGRKERAVPVDKEFWELLGPYLDYRAKLKTNSQKLLLHEFHGLALEYTSASVHMLVKRIAKPCRFHCSPHTIRRSFGRHLWLQGCSIEQISQLLGHSSIETTIRYLGISDMDLRYAIEQFRPSYAKMYQTKVSQ